MWSMWCLQYQMWYQLLKLVGGQYSMGYFGIGVEYLVSIVSDSVEVAFRDQNDPS